MDQNEHEACPRAWGSGTLLAAGYTSTPAAHIPFAEERTEWRRPGSRVGTHTEPSPVMIAYER